MNTGPATSEHATNRRRGVPSPGWPVVAAIVVAVAVTVAGCSSSSTTSTTSTTKASTSTTTSGLSAAAVRSLQVALLAVGCYAGSVDGVAGRATTLAVRSFQSADGLSVDGIYGTATKAKLLAAVSAGKKVCTTTGTTTTTSTTAATSTTKPPSGSGVPAGATAAINAYEAAHGPAAGTWVITSSQVSAVDPNYVLFRIGPASTSQVNVQPGYGIVHLSGGTWSVVGFGSAQVGCPGSGQSPVVPMPVLSGFGLTCPATG